MVTISSTGIATPSLEARAAARVGFRADVERVPVFGLGCAGGVSGISIASRLAQSRPGSVVLLVAVEICTIAFRLDLLTKANIVASALFGDGAAACVLQADETGIAAVEMVGQHTWPETLDIMGWNVGVPLLAPDDHALLLIDHQYLQLLALRSHTSEAVVNNTTFLAKAAKLFKVPTLLTTAFAERQELFQEVQAVFPDQKPIDRTGLNAWDDPRVLDWVKKAGK